MGIKEDAFLPLLPPEVTVMHDHNRVNYNEVFSYQNIECNVHLLRDLRKCTENTTHTWSAQLEKLINDYNTKRSQLIEQGKEAFTYLEELHFFGQLDTFIACGVGENATQPALYYQQEERALLNRLTKYRAYYFAWVLNFELPFSNNLSERSLCGVKSKMKVAGQFQSTEAAQAYATIRSYVESCYRHGVDSIEALDRLMMGNPYTVQELKTSKYEGE